MNLHKIHIRMFLCFCYISIYAISIGSDSADGHAHAHRLPVLYPDKSFMLSVPRGAWNETER